MKLEGIKVAEKGDNQICPEETLWRRVDPIEKKETLETLQHNKVRSIH